MSISARRHVPIALLVLFLCYVNASIEDQSAEVFELLVANDTSICRIKPQDNNSQVFLITDATSKVIALDYHRSRNLIFWIDSAAQCVKSRSLDTDDQRIHTVAKKTGSEWEPVALAVDFIGDVLYVVDLLGRKVEVYDLENEGRGAIVVATDLDRPIDIALDPREGFMFIADNDRIVQMNMDGSSIRKVVSKSIEFAITSLTIDHTSKRIYWYDSDLKIIESSNYDGDYLQIVHRVHDNHILNFNDLSSLSFFNSQLYFLTNSKSVFRVDITEPKSQAAKVSDNIDSSLVRVLRPVEKVDAFPCKVANCKHMCLLHSGSERRSCICPVNQVLKSDGYSCRRLDEFLLYSQKEVIKGRKLDPDVSSSLSPVVAVVTAKRSHALSIDFDYVRRRVYFADASSKKIYGSDIKTGHREELSSFEGQANIAVDWLAQNLYYTDFVAGSLCVMSLRNSSNHKCLLDGLTGPRFVITNPQKGQVYFYDDDKIKRINTDGTKLTIIHTPLAHKVLALLIDRSANRFYWLQTDSKEPQQVRIHNSDLEGWGEQSVEAPLLNNCVGGGAVAIKDDWIYAVCDHYEKLVRVNKTSGEQLAMITNSLDGQGFFALTVFAPQIPKTLTEQLQNSPHPCLKNNGGCSNFCFGVPSAQNQTSSQRDTPRDTLVRVCTCPEGQKLDNSHACVSVGNIRPEDQVQACENDWEYSCKNGRCIPKSQLCDGVNDCLDRSDEVDCPDYRRDFMFGG